MKTVIALLPIVLLAATSGSGPELSNDVSHAATRSAEGNSDLDLVQYASPMCGTDSAVDTVWGDNNCFPGAVAPFGMLQWSPDTETGEHPGGYFYPDSRISDFSLIHMSGGGCPYGQDIAFMPLLDATPTPPRTGRIAFAEKFSHANEVALPGYYVVKLDNGIKVELTATTRSGLGRFVYPNGGRIALMINAAGAVDAGAKSTNDVFNSGVISATININAARRSVTGSAVGGRFCQCAGVRTVYFAAVFNRPFTSWSVWNDTTETCGGVNASGTNTGVFLVFDAAQDKTVLAKVGISYVSAANAMANLEAESPVSAFTAEDFDRAVEAARDNWNSWLNRIQVSGGATDDRKTFYSMLYHALQAPSVCSDVNGEYMGYDGRVHKADGHVHYCLFSGWDIYRSECQLLAMIAPTEASDMAQSLVANYQQAGAFPRWGAIDSVTGIMIGDPAAPMIASFHAFGATNFDTQTALKGLVRAATDPSVRAKRSGIVERDALDEYIKLGYVTEHHLGGNGSVSMTLEYATADAALALFAKALGDNADYSALIRQAQNWRNLYNASSGYFQMRRRDGSWAPGFAANVSDYDGETAYVEGTAGQYVWMVPFNVKELVQLMGGQEVASRRLDEFFTKLNVGFNRPDAAMAWMGNEPCSCAPWIYCFIGEPYKTQKLVREIILKLYSSSPAGYAGNDDLGQMSSWYIFSALGMYPEIPGSDVLVLGSPLFPKAVVKLRHGELTIVGSPAVKELPYVQSLTLNGRNWVRPWIRYADISHGGTLAFALGSEPNKRWGTDPADAPPSFGEK